MEPTEKKKSSPTDHLANERTFLAWIRTSIAIMAFGFVVVKFALFIKQVSLILGEGHTSIALPNRGYSALIGTALVALGTVMSLLAFFRYKNIEKQLHDNTFFPSLTLTLFLTIAMILVGILLVIYLVPSL
jgi:putative membrane protein